MPLPVLLAVDQDQDALEDVETQLVQRYAHEYRVECLGDPEGAVRMLTDLARAGEEVALVLMGISDTTGGELLERVRQLHPHAKRALLVPSGAWTDQPTAEAILDSMALGRIDYYVLWPAASSDEVFHEAVSSFLLEWATDRRIVPHTVHIVGEEWSGRAYELRDVFERCAVPHTFSLGDSDEGRELLAKAGPEAKLPLMVLPDGRALSDPSNTEIAEAAGARSTSRSTPSTSSSWAPGRRACPRPSMAPPRGCAPSWWTRAASGDRPDQARGFATTSASPRASAAPGSLSRPTSRPRSSGRASCSCTGQPPSIARETGSTCHCRTTGALAPEW